MKACQILNRNLTRQQKESIFLLQIGTFLEYFDLMLYVHMAVLLNELFFPPADPKTESIIAALAFCSTYLLRPFGALIFGYIGDNIGRKATIIITTTLMSLSCVAMANLPTYAEVGITATIIVSILRMIQGMTSMGEVMGAKIYITEITKPPKQFLAVASVEVAAALGGIAALGVAALTMQYHVNWRYAFWIGAFIAIIGAVSRTKLRETPDFADAKRQRNTTLARLKEQGLSKAITLLEQVKPLTEEKINMKTFGYFLALQCSWPFCFYMAYIYFVPILKNSFNYTPADIILHNLYISFFQLAGVTFVTLLTVKIYPLLISKFSNVIFIIASIISPFILTYHSSIVAISLVQIMFVMSLKRSPSDSILIKHFPLFRRFTGATFGYALARAVMYIIVSFGLVYLTEWFGYFGIWVIAIPLALVWFKSINYYITLEKEVGNYPAKGKWQVESSLS
jgi:MFS family permease